MNKEKLIVILNGNATSGKNTFANMVGELVPSHHYSYVDFTCNMLRSAGINVDDKSEEMRKLLCDVNNSLEEYDDIPFIDCSDITYDFYDNKIDTNILFIDCREPEKIDRMKKEFDAITVFVKSNISQVTSNAADAKVLIPYTYDFVVDNTSTLDNLQREAKRFASEYCLKM